MRKRKDRSNTPEYRENYAKMIWGKKKTGLVNREHYARDVKLNKNCIGRFEQVRNYDQIP